MKLSLAFPDRGGTVRFINQGFGESIFAGGINNLLWISYIIMLSLYASAFGSYAPNLLKIIGVKTDFHIYASAVIILALAINYYSIKVVGKIEMYAVFIKLVILLSFIGIGVYGLFSNPAVSQLDITNWENPLKLLTGGLVIFVAYEGFELIANAVPDIENPKKNIPKAYYYSVIFVILLYVVIAIITVGSLSFKAIATAQDYALAEAARPMLGKIGFTVITIAALISTFSAINASLYGGSRVSFEIAEDGELPHHLTGKLWNQPVGLMITAISTLVMVNLLKLESISTAGSIGFLLIFSLVNFIGFKLSAQINGNRFIPLIGFLLGVIALASLIEQQYSSDKIGVFTAAIITATCFIMEWIYKRSVPKKSMTDSTTGH